MISLGGVVHLLASAVVTSLVLGVGAAQPDQPAPIQTTLCELMARPRDFNGKMVRVGATVTSRLEWGGVTDSTCSASLLLDRDGFVLTGLTGEYAFLRFISDLRHPKSLQWRPIELPPPVRLNQDITYRKFQSYTQQRMRRGDGRVCSECPLFRVTATFVGRFDHLESQFVAVRASRKASPVPQLAGFGHLNASLSRLVLESVSDVAAEPIDLRIYGLER